MIPSVISIAVEVVIGDSVTFAEEAQQIPTYLEKFIDIMCD